ncbi:protein-(glutamine-N5) methyltransferase, release factor-specific [Mycoplasmopsis bovirhinis]|uniref:peptide chain release factor N(5)-glutamine methyltransferase n=1 Tax=Mycoplasmopsis bovirhinis TaxID=29553 RepID=UPI000C05C83F|nr:peptide chain release factor N(5)-glutamine methyltransferase [Mycoplasmopsis bovirhinis]ATO30845.1 protein-(glutamine-N5) methyltransferase, release factor-specific [Mycoplasmopsis bovirhinis]
MPSIKDLLLEKRRYGLEQTISSFESELLKQGMPVQKIIGYIEMANVKIDLSQKVLIPRYETEELILKVLKDNQINKSLNVLDLCSGSGFIGLALKKAMPLWILTLADISFEAIKQAKINARQNNLDVNITQSNLFENLSNQKFDLIISNPPYLSINEKLDKSVLDFEPHEALFAPDQGLMFYKEIIKKAKDYLNPNGLIYFEINPLHYDWWLNLTKNYKIEILKDISQRPRIVKFKY